jgi:transcriptional regulator with GAF, ATPase, and Fis domain
MRLLAGSDIIDFHNSRADVLAITTDNEYVHFDSSDLEGRTHAYSYVTTEEGDEVQVLLEFSTIEEGEWFPDALDDNGELDAGVADEMAGVINNDADLHTRLEVVEIRKATAAWEASAQETNRLAEQRARRIAAFVRRCGSQSHAARLLGLDQSTVNKLVRKVS